MTERLSDVPVMLPIKAVSEKTGVSYDAIRKLCLRKEIAFIRCGNKYLINLNRFIDYLNGEQAAGAVTE